MINPVNLISEMLQNIPNPRTKEVIARRFGLKDGQRHTLEAIGQDYKITRERVRQIEESGLAVLRQEKIAAKFYHFYKKALQKPPVSKNHIIKKLEKIVAKR